MKQSCDDFEMMIADALSGRLDERSLSAFEAHLENCPACAASFERFERTASILEDAYPASASENAKIWARVEGTLHSKPTVSVRSMAQMSPWAPIFGAAAMVALAVLLFLASPKAQKVRQAHEMDVAANVNPTKDSKDNKDSKDKEHKENKDNAVTKANEVKTDIGVGEVGQVNNVSKENEINKDGPLNVKHDAAPQIVVDAEPTIHNPQPAMPPARGPREVIDDARGLALLRRTGAVAVFDAGHQAWRPIVAGERVPYGAAVRTGAGALAELAFGESRVRLDEKTEVTIALTNPPFEKGGQGGVASWRRSR